MSTDTAAETSIAPERVKLSLDVKIDKPSACERHVTVSVSREDVDRYLKEQFDEVAPKAELPGFRAGRAPRKLVEKSFRSQVTEQVKGKLLMDSLAQISDDHEFSAISEPDFDFDKVAIPEAGPLTFEFDIEVRPEFDLPQWKGLKIERLVREYSDSDVQEHLQRLLARYGSRVTQDGPVGEGEGQFIRATLTFRQGDQVLSTLTDEEIEVRKVLSFVDGRLEDFNTLVVGKSAGDKVSGKVKISADAQNEALRGQEVEVDIEIHEVRAVKLPELDEGFLDRIGGFENETDLRTEVKKELERQMQYQQDQGIRKQITSLLTIAANWELPPDLLRRQAGRELERSVMELQRNGFDNNTIQAYANELRQNTLSSTATSLKEHFILERIAEEEKVDAEPGDYDAEIELIADQMNESARRVRARLEKRGQIDTLRNQIVERKVIGLIKESATFNDVPYVAPKSEVTGVAFSISGNAAEIAEAKHAGSDDEKRPGSIAR